MYIEYSWAWEPNSIGIEISLVQEAECDAYTETECMYRF